MQRAPPSIEAMSEFPDNSRTNLIINYLPQTLSDSEFNQLFAALGPLQSARILRDKRTGYSFGYGFVNYQSEDDAKKAIETLNGLQLMHKKIKVAYARPPTDDIRGSNLYVANLPRTMTQEELTSLFAVYGEIINVKILMDSFTGLSKGCGFILFAKKAEAEAAIANLHMSRPDGSAQPITVKKAKDDNDRSLGSSPPVQMMPHGFYPGPYPGARAPGPMRRVHGQSYRFHPTSNNGAGAGAAAPSAGAAAPSGGFILFVYNIGPEADESLLYSLFSPFGGVTKVNVMKDMATGKGKGFGFVTMVNQEEANFAISQLNGYMMSGKPLQVSFKK